MFTQNLQKIDPFPPCPQNVCNGSTLLVREDTPTILKNLVFLHQKVWTSASEEPPYLQNVCTRQIDTSLLNCGHLLLTAPYNKCQVGNKEPFCNKELGKV